MSDSKEKDFEYDFDRDDFSSPRGRADGPPRTEPPTGTTRANPAEGEGPLPETVYDPAEKLEPSGFCVMIGPTEAGKSTLLASMSRACQMMDDDGISIKFTPQPETAVLIKETVNRILKGTEGLSATTNVHKYGLSIRVTEKKKNFWSSDVNTSVDVSWTDGGGGFIFAPQEAYEGLRREMFTAIRNTNVLLLCIDVTRPNLDMLHQELDMLIAETSRRTLIDPEITWVQRLLLKVPYLNYQLPEPHFEQCLNVDRVLILLTQVDKLTGNYKNARDIAARIDPVNQARAVLTPELLQMLLKAIHPTKAQLAVGLCSAYGFLPQGRPFADKVGSPSLVREGTGTDILRQWKPFGIREAMHFIATGKCRGMVKRMNASDLNVKTSDEFDHDDLKREKIYVN